MQVSSSRKALLPPWEGGVLSSYYCWCDLFHTWNSFLSNGGDGGGVRGDVQENNLRSAYTDPILLSTPLILNKCTQLPCYSSRHVEWCSTKRQSPKLYTDVLPVNASSGLAFNIPRPLPARKRAMAITVHTGAVSCGAWHLPRPLTVKTSKFYHWLLTTDKHHQQARDMPLTYSMDTVRWFKMATSEQKKKDLWHIYNHEMLSSEEIWEMSVSETSLSKWENRSTVRLSGLPRVHPETCLDPVFSETDNQSERLELIWSWLYAGRTRLGQVRRAQPLGKRGPMAERYVKRLQRRLTRPYPEYERQRGASDQRPLLFTRPWNSSQALANQRQKT